MHKYSPGTIVSGVVTGIEKYGAFVSLDSIYSGLIHISEMSDGFVRNITDFVNIGDKINVKILDNNEENGKLKLSIKNVNYKISNGKKRYKIVETESGFNQLHDYLDQWIASKIKEIEKK